MLIITDDIYRALALQLIQAIEQKYYFSGSIEYDTQEMYSTLVTSVIIDKKSIVFPEGSHDVIVDVVPVWWEFKTFQRDGEVHNSFSWREFVEFLPINKID